LQDFILFMTLDPAAYRSACAIPGINMSSAVLLLLVPACLQECGYWQLQARVYPSEPQGQSAAAAILCYKLILAKCCGHTIHSQQQQQQQSHGVGLDSSLRAGLHHTIVPDK
jgi:hypothetical protein